MLSAILVLFGALLILGGLGEWLTNSALTFNEVLLMMCGAILLIVGILVFVADLFESFLSHGQTALVDGLQAG